MSALLRKWLSLGIILVIALILRIYKLDTLPGEFYGDIDIIYTLVKSILLGEFPYTFVLSNGPLYGYTIAPIIWVLGIQGYLPYKIASVIVSLVGIIGVYFFVEQISTRRVASIGAFLLATSSWYLVFSRLGNAQIVIPVLTVVSYFFLAYGGLKDKSIFVIIGGSIASLGLYEMPQTFILPILYFCSAIMFLSWRKKGFLALIMFVSAIPFLIIFFNHADQFAHGYIGEKLQNQSTSMILSKLADNTIRSLGMLHIQGDSSFRSNPPLKPHLDNISSLFFLIGVTSVLKSKKLILFTLVPFFALQLPSILVVSETMATPSASRTIGILPFVVALTAIGINTVIDFCKYAWIKKALLVVLFLGILFLNIQRYFVEYATTLPNKNTPIGKIIAAQIDALPDDVMVVMYGCCWGQWGQPEPSGIENVIQKERSITVVNELIVTCPKTIISDQKIYAVFNPALFIAISPECFSRGRVTKGIGYDGSVIFYTFSKY